ncbi:MAG: hypothetical protein ACOZHQ_04640 [Thermodesulfobacteriota bacterium]
MSASLHDDRPRARLYLVAPRRELAHLLPLLSGLGPLAEPEPPALPPLADFAALAGAAAYGPRPPQARPADATRGFFLDRYVY